MDAAPGGIATASHMGHGSRFHGNWRPSGPTWSGNGASEFIAGSGKVAIRWQGADEYWSGGHCMVIRFPLLALVLFAMTRFGTANAQIQNLRFDDTDTNTGSIGGIAYWDRPAAGDSTIISYRVFIAEDAAGTNEVQVGNEVLAGAWTSEVDIPANTASSGKTHLLVYLVDSTGKRNPASICLQDNPTGFARTMYVTTLGYTKAANLKIALVAACHANEHRIKIEMVATAKWSGSAVQETDFDNADENSATAAFSVTFPTGTSMSNMETAIASYVDDAPLPTVSTDSINTAGNYRLGMVQVASEIGPFVPVQPEPDMGRSFARSCVEFSVASSAMVNRVGEVRIQTRADKEPAVTAMIQIFQSWSTPTYENLDAGTSALNAIDARATASSAACWQISGVMHHADCT